LKSGNFKMDVKIIYSDCGFCGSGDYECLYDAPLQSHYSRCQIVKCSGCGLVRTNPRPSQASLTTLYTNEYYSRKIPDLKNWTTQLKIFAIKHKLSLLYPRIIPLHLSPNASICDVGCGSGQWLNLMRSAHPNLNLYGFEIDSKTAQIASELCNGDIQHGDFLNNTWPDEIFDFVTFWDVFEHIENLKSTILEVQRLLKPNGILIIVSPNFDCVYSKYFRGNWWALLFDQHLYHFTEQILKDILQTVNLEPVLFTRPLIPTYAHWNFVNLLEEMKFKKEGTKLDYFTFQILKNLTKIFDNIYLSKFVSQHLMMCAQKIPAPVNQ
jgi:2-polyprenyl-3-methyl-5-hydroxy-6-metoxy-1,4-benzoquinol methylase